MLREGKTTTSIPNSSVVVAIDARTGGGEKPGPKKGQAQEVVPLLWQALLGEFVDEIVEQAHRDIEELRKEAI